MSDAHLSIVPARDPDPDDDEPEPAAVVPLDIDRPPAWFGHPLGCCCRPCINRTMQWMSLRGELIYTGYTARRWAQTHDGTIFGHRESQFRHPNPVERRIWRRIRDKTG